MSLPPAPIRFLMLVIGGWVAARTISLVPWLDDRLAAPDVAMAAAPLTPRVARARAAMPPRAMQPWVMGSPTAAAARPFRAGKSAPAWASTGHSNRWHAPVSLAGPGVGASPPMLLAPSPLRSPAVRARPSSAWPEAAIVQPEAFALRPPGASTARLSGSAWLFVRGDGRAGLAPGGTLGGSQAGARLTYRLNRDARRPLAVSARVYSPLDRPRGAEVAVGVDWRPIAGLPVNLLAERRERIGREGRSDFSLTVHGGTERRLLGDRVRVEAYGQAGIVGVEEGDLFADGAILATTRIGPVDVGCGAWGGAQPGVSRLDLGPHAGVRLPVGRATISAAAQWRFRVAGDAAPASGPALTLSTGF